VEQFRSVLRARDLEKADRPSKHHRDTAETKPGVGGCDRTSGKRGKLGEVTQR
jgi:hypothetical protein